MRVVVSVMPGRNQPCTPGEDSWKYSSGGKSRSTGALIYDAMIE
jgi:hypothetical protein